MTSFADAFKRLADLTNYERKKPTHAHRFDLEAMERLVARLGAPQRRLRRVVQVGGSKGKGTVTSLLAGMARAVGIRTGAYLSPHVVDVRERIAIDGAMIGERELAPALTAVARNLEDGQTWFEAFTAAALLCFAEADCDLTVLEVGLGGRLDSTSVVEKAACGITGIELEHTHVLGDTIEAIAAEKAGILRAGVPCVTGADGIALDVIEQHAARLGAPLTVLGRDSTVEASRRGQAGHHVAIHGLLEDVVELDIPVFAAAQVRSFALALALFACVFPNKLRDLLALDPVTWVPDALPVARFDVLGSDPPIVVDGAHTDGSLRALAADLRAVFPGRRFNLVFAIAAGKRWRSGSGELLRLVDRAWVAPLEGKPGVPTVVLRDFATNAGVDCREVATVAEGVAAALRDDAGLLVTGSLYAAGDALRVLRPDGRH